RKTQRLPWQDKLQEKFYNEASKAEYKKIHAHIIHNLFNQHERWGLKNALLIDAGCGNEARFVQTLAMKILESKLESKPTFIGFDYEDNIIQCQRLQPRFNHAFSSCAFYPG